MADTETIGLLTSAIAALAAAITWMFRLVLKLQTDQAKQGEKLGEYRGRQEGITKLSAEVLDVVHKATSITTKDLQKIIKDQ